MLIVRRNRDGLIEFGYGCMLTMCATCAGLNFWRSTLLSSSVIVCIFVVLTFLVNVGLTHVRKTIAPAHTKIVEARYIMPIESLSLGFIILVLGLTAQIGNPGSSGKILL